MEIVTIEQAQETAKTEWKEYCKAIRENIPDDAEYMKYYKSIKNCLYYLSKGKHILDLYASMKAAGLNEQGLPKLAICKANLSKVFFEWQSIHGRYAKNRWRDKNAIYIENHVWGLKTWRRVDNDKYVSTIVPKVPAHFLPKGKLENYFILWEVETWTLEPPRDPILLKKINGSDNLFAVLAMWDLTELERAVLRGAVT